MWKRLISNFGQSHLVDDNATEIILFGNLNICPQTTIGSDGKELWILKIYSYILQHYINIRKIVKILELLTRTRADAIFFKNIIWCDEAKFNKT